MQREIDKTSKLEAASSTASNIKTGKYMALGVRGSCVVILSSMLLEWLIYIQEKIQNVNQKCINLKLIAFIWPIDSMSYHETRDRK